MLIPLRKARAGESAIKHRMPTLMMNPFKEIPLVKISFNSLTNWERNSFTLLGLDSPHHMLTMNGFT